MKKGILKELLLYGGGDLVPKFLGLLIFPIYTHIFSPDEFGLINILLTGITFYTSFSLLGVDSAVSKFFYEKDNSADKGGQLIKTGLVFISSWGLLLFALLVGFGVLFHSHCSSCSSVSLELIFLAIGLTLPSVILQYVLSVLRIQLRSQLFVYTSVISGVINILMTLLFVKYLDLGMVGYFLGISFSSIPALIYVLFKIENVFINKYSFQKLRQILKFSVPIFFYGLASWVLLSMDSWMLLYLESSAEVGIYSIGLKFGVVMYFFTSAFNKGVIPIILKKYNEDQSAGQALIKKLFTYWFLSVAFVGNLVCLAIPYFFDWFIAKEYESSIVVSLVLVFNGIVSSLTFFTGIGLYLKNKTKIIFYGSILAIVLNFFLNLILINLMSTIGAAIATLLSTFFVGMFYLVMSYSNLKINFEWSKLVSLLLIQTLLISAMILVLKSFFNPLTQFGLNLTLFLAWLIILFILKIIPVSYLKDIRNILKKIMLIRLYAHRK